MRTKKVPIDEIMMQLQGDLGALLVLLPQAHTLNGRMCVLVRHRKLHNMPGEDQIPGYLFTVIAQLRQRRTRCPAGAG